MQISFYIFQILYENDIVNRYHSYNRLGGRFVFNNDIRVIEQTYNYIIDETSHPYHIDTSVRKEYLFYNDDGHETEIETVYSYDGLHRLVGVSPFDGSASNNIQYTYDSLNRLTRSRQSNGDDLKYNYDSTHNIISVINNHSSTTIHSMTYSMNRMMSFDNYSLIYDPNYVFNPYQYGVFDNDNVLTDGLTFAFMGKRLMNITKTGTFDIPSMSFSYDFSGKRLSKTTNGVIHQYYYDGDKLVYETETNVASSILIHEKKFFYDENGILTFMELDGVKYFYYIDATHTVRGLFNSDGELIVRYSYDAWGNVTDITDYSSNSLSILNPFLFKCYYYDNESKWYYCLSRYYIPLWMRWLSIDDTSYLTSESPAGYNLYVYCNDNPIMYEDPTGHISILLGMILIGSVLGAVSYAASEGVSYLMTGDWSWSWGQFAGSIIGGAIGGALAAAGFGPFVTGFSTSFFASATGMSLQSYCEGGEYSFEMIITTSIISGLFSAILSIYGNSIKAPIISSGRNSFSAVSKSIITKYLSGTIRNMAFKTMGKIFATSLFASIPEIIWDGISNNTNISIGSSIYSFLNDLRNGL